MSEPQQKAEGLERIAVIGNGPVGVHFCNELLELSERHEVLVFGDEPYDPYNRVALSQLLSGEKTVNELELNLFDSERLTCHWHTHIESIDTTYKVITEKLGHEFYYDKLVIATGSRAHIPSIPGVHMRGVYSFRNMKDAQALISRQVGSRHTVVMGGGLLGIEAARAMRRLSTKVTLIHHSAWLMNRQLDEATANNLKIALEKDDIDVMLATSVAAIDGAAKVGGIVLRDGRTIECDTVIIATGIRPNLELARASGIAVGRGVRISENLETSVDDVYAIGEVTEFDGEIYGLVAPGLEQAATLARRLAGDESYHYEQRALAARLKVLDTPVVSIGQMGLAATGPDSRFMSHSKGGAHRSLHFERGNLIGASAVGTWPDQERLKDLIDESGSLNLFQTLRFRFFGEIWSGDEQVLDHHVICNCRQVTAGALRICAAQDKALDSTGAGTVCGSCIPLLQQFQPEGAVEVAAPEGGIIWQSGVGVLSVILILVFIASSPFIAIPDTYTSGHISEWWTVSEKRQWTGFTLLALTVLSLFLTGRKRIKVWKWLSFSAWRGWHIVLTTVVLALLFFHTGQSDFQGINGWLITSFWAAAILGLLTSLMSWREQAVPSVRTKRTKRWAVTGHIIAFWPLPVLLAFHILSVYWY